MNMGLQAVASTCSCKTENKGRLKGETREIAAWSVKKAVARAKFRCVLTAGAGERPRAPGSGVGDKHRASGASRCFPPVLAHKQGALCARAAAGARLHIAAADGGPDGLHTTLGSSGKPAACTANHL